MCRVSRPSDDTNRAASYWLTKCSQPMFMPTSQTSTNTSVRLDVRRLTFHNHPLRLVPVFRHEPFDALIVFHEVECLAVCPDGLHQTDCVGVHSLGVLSHIRDRMRHLEAKPEQVTNVLEQRDYLRIEVDRELEATTT